MIPFGTFMQATGSMPAMGKGGTGHSVMGKNGSSHAGSAQAGAEAPDSFSVRFQKLTGVDATRASDGESKEQPHNEITESEATETKAMDWDQLTSMIADAMELSSELSDDGLPVDGMDLSGMEDVLQKMANGDSLKGEGSFLQALTNLAIGSVNESDQDLRLGGRPLAAVQKMSVDGQQEKPPGQGANASSAMTESGAASVPTDQDLRLGGRPLAAVQKMSVDGQQEKPPGQGANASGAMAESGAASVPTAGTEQGIENAGLTRTQEAVNSAEFDQALQAQQHKEKPVFPVHPAVAQPAETVEEENHEVNAQRLNDGTKKVVQGDNPVSSPKDSPQTQLPLSVSTGKDDENSTAADEDGPDNRRVVRSEIQDKNQSADAGEKELPKGSTSSDPVKTVSPEQNRFSDTIQDATRTTTEKTGTVQAAPPERTESSAAQRFQTTVMDQIVDKANLRSIHGRSEIQIRLKPDFLGNVQMNIAADKEQVVVRMITDHPVVKEVVEANLHHLKTELQHQGLTIDRFEVTVNPDAGQQHNREQFAQMFKNPSFQNGQGQDPEPEPEAHHRENGRREDSRSGGDDQPKEEGINYFA